MKKENVYYSFLNRLNETDQMVVTYNDWESEIPQNSHDSVVTVSKENETGSECEDSDDDQHLIEPFSPLNIEKPVNSSLNNIHKNKSNIIDNNGSRNPEKITTNPNLQMIKKIKDLRIEFESFCEQIPVLGYNSAKYDLNLIKERLAKHLGLHLNKNGKKFVIKKNNAYMCIANRTLRFLDMLAYLPPNTSYDKFLKTFKVETRKLFFPMIILQAWTF